MFMDAAIENELFPVTAQQALEKWDAGNNIFTIEMGGLGPGYEQVIHILVFELIRDQNGRPVPEFEGEKDRDKWLAWGSATVDRCNPDLGFSGAQVGAAKNFAYHVLRDGWRKTIRSFPSDRQIQVSSAFPQPPAVKR